ncbi:major facilitator superfamily domain-containing protein [Lipomyces arxii]|uniref:major facilitator superfamily domain-containing protein n=1 Tax=Lipomyces arxii TaxID=56418 RepID=UPI0034CEA3D4
MDTIRYSFFGEICHYLSGGRMFRYPDQAPGFKYIFESDDSPITFETPENVEKNSAENSRSRSTVNPEEEAKEEGNDPTLIGWYGPDDPEDPHNWSNLKKTFVIVQICFITVSLYMGSSIYTPGVAELTEDFGISTVVATIPLCVYVLGYGIGQMIAAPLSEIPAIGRNWVYMPTAFIFVVLQVPTALSKNIGSLIVLRFICGLLCSPALSNGAASLGDFLPPHYVPYGIAIWGGTAVFGPVLGPLLGGVFAQVLGWRWTFWFMLWISALSFGLIFFFLPETYGPTILSRRAARLRRSTGNPSLTTKGDLDFAAVTTGAMVQENLIRPFIISFTEPGVLMLNIYVGFMYAVMYTWFEAFPIVFVEMHHFNLIENGLTYIGLLMGCATSCAIYLYLIGHYMVPWIVAGVRPEKLFKLSFAFAPLLPISMIFFGWTGTPNIHWIVPVIASSTFGVGGFVVFQVIFNYLGLSYPRYLASVFAGNGLFRSFMAAAFPLFARQLFVKLGPSKFPVGFGSTVLAGIGLVLACMPYFFYHAGHLMRVRSKYAN